MGRELFAARRIHLQVTSIHRIQVSDHGASQVSSLRTVPMKRHRARSPTRSGDTAIGALELR